MENRPDPDELLKAIQREEQKKLEGKLRIFLGMSAGVGKTYEMLTSAHERLGEGRDIVIGVVVTHGRVETENLAKNVPVIPLKKIVYRDIIIEEMDIDAILERKPEIVVVDDLAHTNAPGSRHPKRWQDVIEILENGIDVYTAINIQHIESRKDDVEKIAGIKIHETVPDLILDRANYIEVVDIPPDDLLQRLKEGKVYLGDKAEQAALNFFKEERLTALREILLRISADKVDRDLESLIIKSSKDELWKTKEKLLLAVGHGPHSEMLVRTAKQMAASLNAPWIALFVDTGKELNEVDEKKVMANLDLARELGAKIVTMTETSLIRGIEKACWQFNISQIVIGKPRKKPIERFLPVENIIERLNKLQNSASIHVVRSGYKREFSEKVFTFRRILKNIPSFLHVTFWVVLLGGINAYLHHILKILPYHSIGLVFLLQVTLIGRLFSVGPTIWASILASQIWNVFFIPPLYTLTIDSPDDIVLCISFIFIATTVGILTSTIKKSQSLLKAQERRTNTLYQLSTEIVESKDKIEALEKISKSLSRYFKGQVSITTKSADGALDYFKKGVDWAFNNPKEWSVVQWCFYNAKMAGKWTDTLPHAKSLCVPLFAKDEILGVLAYMPKDQDSSISVNDREVLITISSQLGLFLQRELFHERTLETEKLKESEILHQTLLNSVSHEIKTPLTAISGIVEALNSRIETDSEELTELRQSLMESVDRLKQVVENILDMSRLESGVLRLKEEWFDFNDIIDNVCSNLKYSLNEFNIDVKIPDNFPLVFIDAKLMEQVFLNLMLNSVKYCAANSNIVIEAIDGVKTLTIFYGDDGPGLLEEDQSKIFEKFYRGKNVKLGGTGLGLTIVKSIILLHKGSIEIIPSSKGLKFKIVLPKHEAPGMPEEYL